MQIMGPWGLPGRPCRMGGRTHEDRAPADRKRWIAPSGWRQAVPAGRPGTRSPRAKRAGATRSALLAFGIVVAAWVSPALATTFRFAFQGDLKSLDSYTLNEGFSLGLLGNVYEGLVKRDKNLAIMPGLAERWEILEPTRWRFYLRKGVKFQHGEDFTADDVVFSGSASGPMGRISRRVFRSTRRWLRSTTTLLISCSPNPIPFCITNGTPGT